MRKSRAKPTLLNGLSSQAKRDALETLSFLQPTCIFPTRGYSRPIPNRSRVSPRNNDLSPSVLPEPYPWASLSARRKWNFNRLGIEPTSEIKEGAAKRRRNFRDSTDASFNRWTASPSSLHGFSGNSEHDPTRRLPHPKYR